jgi:hypothetical protein
MYGNILEMYAIYSTILSSHMEITRRTFGNATIGFRAVDFIFIHGFEHHVFVG